jgi:Xaa-Pro aminopeptidase
MNVDDKWKGIGVRIEDDILVTNDGNINLTEKVPSCPKEIESLMA